MTEQAELLPPEAKDKPAPARKGAKPKQEVAVAAPIPTPAAPSAGDNPALLAVLQKIMSDPTLPMERVKQAIDFYKEMDAYQAKKAFNAAMADARAEIPPIIKNRTVDFTSSKGRTNYKHEDLAGIAAIVDPILGKHGLSYRYRTTSVPNEPVSVTCIVSHRLGYSEENSLTAGRDESGNKNSIQAIGSTVTYLQRYTLKAALGLASAHDDDGKAASLGDEGGVLTEQQAAELNRLINATKTNIPLFCKMYGVEQVEEIPAQQYGPAKTFLEIKQERQNV